MTNDPTSPARETHPYTFRGEGTGAYQRLSWFLGRLASRVVSMLFFRLHVGGQNNLPASGGALLAVNHQSYLDPWLAGIGPARQIHYMARDSLFKGGFLHYLMELWNVFPVRRGAADLTAIRTAVERLDRGFILTIFPEGTRSEDGAIGTVAPGVALILNRAKADVPVIPVIVDGAFEAWPRKAKFPRPRQIRLVYGKPIPAAEWRVLSPEELAWRIRKEMVNLQKEMGSPHAAVSEMKLEAERAQMAANPGKARRRAR